MLQRLQKVDREQASGFGNAEVRQPATETFRSCADGRKQVKVKEVKGKEKFFPDV